MHVFDCLVGCMSRLFRFHNYGVVGKAYATLLFIAGLSLREWAHRLGTLFRTGNRRLVAVDETVVKRFGHAEYVWAAVDVDSGEILDVYASRDRSLARALTFLRRVLRMCEDKPAIVVDRGPWYPWA